MKLTIGILTGFLIISILGFLSCKRELSCEGCNIDTPSANKLPVANGGADQTITLPKDSVLLDGSTSTDPDGTIISYKWAKIAGPVSFSVNKPDSSKTIIKALVAGVYQFELTVTDNGGLSAKDTVQILVDAPGNQPPVACAGADQVITLPANVTTLDGSCSVDPDNNITAYIWTKISGSSTFNMTNANAVQTQVTNLVPGVYHFELKVTDAGGLFSKDTMQITVNTTVAYTCSNTNRPQINAQLIPVDTLSQARFWMGAASAGNKLVFAGGHTYGNLPSSRVDIYNFTTNTWSTAELNVARAKISAVAAGSKIFFAGGEYYHPSDFMWDNPYAVNVMDIYDVVSNTWSVVPLPGNRTYTASAAAGNKVFFAHGSEVNIYDISTQTWSTQSLSDGRSGPSVVAANNKVFFAGGDILQSGIIIPKNTIDIYDNATNTWSVSSLAEGRAGLRGIAAAGKVYFAGGYNSNFNNFPLTTSCKVDVIDANTGNKSVQYLSRQWQHPVGWAVIKNSKIAFLNFNSDNTEFDIYDLATTSWSIGMLPSLQNLIFWGASIISVNNTIYIAGAFTSRNLPKQIYKLEF